MKISIRFTSILLVIIPLTINCNKREWNNPYDPTCPKDYFTPTNFIVIQEGNNAKLTWNEDVTNFDGIQIYRKIDTENAVSIGKLSKGIGQFIDAGLVGGKKYSYSLSAYAGANESNLVTGQLTPLYMPSLALPSASNIGLTSITISGTITSNGGVIITSCGVCWSTSQNPTINGSKIINEKSDVNFLNAITGLSPGVSYFIRTFAINSQGTAYSDQINITTNATFSTIITQPVTALTSLSADCGGDITADGGAPVTARGVCWNTIGNPTIADFKTNDGSGTGSFISPITGLQPGTNYYVRAYSTNSIGTTYGNSYSFITSTTVPVLTTNSLSNFAPTSLTCGGTITSNGGAAITARGVCWNTSPNPTTANSKTADGYNSGTYSSLVTGLLPEVTYYIRAYATNNVGISYGNELSFKTIAALPILSSTSLEMLSSTSVACISNVSDDGGSAVTARGVCWSRNAKPTTADAKSNDGSGVGTYNSTITGLTEGALYYIRAYATNGVGTAYGNETSIVASTLPSVTSLKVTSVRTTTVQCTGNVNSNGGSPVTARGLCWSTSVIPTIANAHSTDGSGTGSFTSNLNGLTPNTLYYVRTYATNQKGTSYGAQMSFVTSYGEVTDVDGNIYQTIRIGNKIWMRENLRTAKYNDGTPISYATGSGWTNATSGAYCWYNGNAASYKNDYGSLYNGFAVATNKLAPAGWHIPTLEEWFQLYSDASYNSFALKESGTDHWNSPNSSGNETGFSALPGGICYPDYLFRNMGESAPWWSSTLTSDGINAFNLGNSSGYGYGSYYLNWGLSVRCVLGSVTAPVVSTYQWSPVNVLATLATLSGTVTDMGGPNVTSRGFCWSTSINPTLADASVTSGSGFGSFQTTVTGLMPGTTYYYRAYATNNIGTSYGLVVPFTTQSDKILYNSSKTYGNAIDIDGHVYKTITIGPLTWFAENLRTTRFNDGTPIQKITNDLSWINTSNGAYCYYSNDESSSNNFGALYNWYTVNTGKLCPIGWRVPSKDEWTSLFNTVNNLTDQLMESGYGHWTTTNSVGNNQSGFTALPGGYRWEDGSFMNISFYGAWWSTTTFENIYAYVFQQYYIKSTPDLAAWKNNIGCSIRCVKD